MKTTQSICDEVMEILERRGFGLGWCGRFYVIKDDPLWRRHPHEICNWIIK